MAAPRESPTPPPPPATPRAGRRAFRLDVPTLVILLAGLIPIVGWALDRRWPQGDVAVGALFVLFAAWQLARALFRRR
jgi:hypothetical protein